MVLISFSVLRKKIVSGEKKQTIRLLRTQWKRVLAQFTAGKKIDLQLYWKSRTPQRALLREEPLKNIYPKYLREITEQEAKQDGFSDLTSLLLWFKRTYKSTNFNEQQVAIIQW